MIFNILIYFLIIKYSSKLVFDFITRKKKLEKLKEWPKALNFFKNNYYLTKNIEKSLEKSNEQLAESANKNIKTIHKNLIKLKENIKSKSDKYIQIIYKIMFLTLEYGDKKVENKSLLIKNINHVIDDIKIDILEQNKINSEIRGLFIIIILPLFVFEIVKDIIITNFTEVKFFYESFHGMISKDIILISIIFCLYFLIKIRRIEYVLKIKEKIWLSFIISSLLIIKHFEVKLINFLIVISLSFLIFLIFNLDVLIEKHNKSKKMEYELFKFNTIILILMHFKETTVKDLLIWFEKSSEFYKKDFQKCISRYDFDPIKALEKLKIKKKNRKFIFMVDKLISIENGINFEEAFESIELEKEHTKKEKWENTLINTNKKLNFLNLISFIPIYLTIILYIALPTIYTSYIKLDALFYTIKRR